MKLEIKYGIEVEVNRVLTTQEDLFWFKEMGYKSITLPAETGKYSDEEAIRAAVVNEFDESKFEIFADELLSSYASMEEVFTNKLQEIFKVTLPATLVILFTQYGSGGSYNTQNFSATMNINTMRDGAKTVYHETIHLLIESWIQKFNIKHWEKERTVDLILNSEEFDFLNYNSWQGNYDGVENYIDDLFNKQFYSNYKEYFAMIASVRA